MWAAKGAGIHRSSLGLDSPVVSPGSWQFLGFEGFGKNYNENLGPVSPDARASGPCGYECAVKPRPLR